MGQQKVITYNKKTSMLRGDIDSNNKDNKNKMAPGLHLGNKIVLYFVRKVK